MTPESVSSAAPPTAPGAGEARGDRGEAQGPLEEKREESPSTSPPASPPSPAPRRSSLDVLLAVLVCALAFLLASTPARNSDLWMHLASGRALLQGRAPLGADPFASTTAGVFWVNHAWLSDVIMYALYEVGDGTALVVAKAVLVTALTGLFFCFRRPGARFGMGAVAAAAAVMALGPWLLLQPVLFSLPGVVLTLYLLERPALVEESRVAPTQPSPAAGGGQGGGRWLILPLFVLWANLDAWFLLGPVLVALYALGAALRRLVGVAPSGRRGEVRALTLLTLAGLAACLLTPYHYRTFAWPTPLGLSHTERVLLGDPLGQGLVVSPFGVSLAAFASPGGWAYCLLLAGGAASFVLRGRALHPGRLLAWLALAALSVYQARAIPFFAAAAGPILALNLQEWRGLNETRRQGDKETRRIGIVLVSLSPCLLVCLLVLAWPGWLQLAWPGWLQPPPYPPRGWAAAPDESLVRMARRVEQRHAEQSLRPDHFALTFSPEAAHYLAWFAPSEKGFLDSRWPLFDQAADDFVRMRRCLLQPDGQGPDRALGPLLDAHQVDRILVYDPDSGRTVQAYRCLLLGGEEWELLDVEGDAALFGRRSAAPTLPSPSLGGGQGGGPRKALDLRQAAYHPDPDRRAPTAAPRAPQPPGYFDAWRRARDDHSADRGEAALYLVYFDVTAERGQPNLGTQWLLALATGLLGSAPGGEPAGSTGALALRLYLTPFLPQESGAPPPNPPPAAGGGQEEGGGGRQAAEAFAAGFAASHDRGPAEALLAAVRAARRALAANPDDAGAYLLLGEAYVRLAGQTREQSWRDALPPLAALRHAQAMTALEQAVLLRPDLDRAHDLLGELYYEDGALDCALDHLRARLRIAEQQAAAGGPEAQAAAGRKPGLQADVDAMEALVGRSEKIYDGNAADKSDPSKVFERASLAARYGLSRKALEMLLESHPAIFGKAGVELELDLMMRAGRAFEVRSWLEPQHEAVVGFSRYHSLQAQAAAACGDYAGADTELDALSEKVRQVAVSPEQLAPVRSAMALRVADAMLARPAAGAGAAGHAAAAFRRFDALRPLGGPADLLRQEADIRVLRGLLALESGAVEDARRHFHAALEVWGDDAAAAAGAGLDFPSRPIARHALDLLEDKTATGEE